MTKGKTQFEVFALQIYYLLGSMKLKFGITDPLHLNKFLNVVIVAEFLKRNTFSVVSFPIKSNVDHDAHKQKKAPAVTSMKRKMV